jgi:hypothetical protein
VATSTQVQITQAYKQKLGKLVRTIISAHFKPSFPGLDPEFLALVTMAICQRESSLRNGPYPTYTGSPDRSFVASSVYQAVLATNDPVKIGNVGRAASSVYGIMQVRGSYLIKKGSKTGMSEIERIRPDLAASVCVTAGDSLEDAILGPDDAAVTRAVTAGLIILQDKYATVPKVMTSNPDGSFTYSKSGLRFSKRITAAVGMYLGLSGPDRFGTTSVDYAASIVGGDSWRIANGYSQTATYAPGAADNYVPPPPSLVVGPSTNGTGMARIVPPDC